MDPIPLHLYSYRIKMHACNCLQLTRLFYYLSMPLLMHHNLLSIHRTFPSHQLVPSTNEDTTSDHWSCRVCNFPLLYDLWLEVNCLDVIIWKISCFPVWLFIHLSIHLCSESIVAILFAQCIHPKLSKLNGTSLSSRAFSPSPFCSSCSNRPIYYNRFLVATTRLQGLSPQNATA